MAKKRYEVRGMDEEGNVWIVMADRKDSAEGIADAWRRQGYTNVQIIEHDRD